MLGLLICIGILSVFITNATDKSCIANDLVDDLKITSPEQGQLVERYFPLAAGLYCYEAEKCKILAAKWHVCLNVTGYDKIMCDNPIFDLLPVELISNQEHQELTISLCNDEVGCICSNTITIRCCLEENDAKAQKQVEQQQKLEYMKYQLQNEVKDDNVIQTKQTPSCWINHPSGLSLKNLYIGIRSSAFNYVKRKAIRNSWLRTLRSEPLLSQTICVYFVLGEVRPSSAHPGLLDYLYIEQSHFHDMLFDDMIPVEDKYSILSYKLLAYIQFIHMLQIQIKHSNNSNSNSNSIDKQYVMIIDDDVYMDILRWAVVLLQSDTYPSKRFYGGRVSDKRGILVLMLQ